MVGVATVCYKSRELRGNRSARDFVQLAVVDIVLIPPKVRSHRNGARTEDDGCRRERGSESSCQGAHYGGVKELHHAAEVE